MAREENLVVQRVADPDKHRHRSNLADVRSCRRQPTASGRRAQRLKGVRPKIGLCARAKITRLCFAQAEACTTSGMRMAAVARSLYSDDASQSLNWLQQMQAQTAMTTTMTTAAATKLLTKLSRHAVHAAQAILSKKREVEQELWRGDTQSEGRWGVG